MTNNKKSEDIVIDDSNSITHQQVFHSKKDRRLKPSIFHMIVYILLGVVILLSIFSTIHIQNNLTKTSLHIIDQQQENKKIEQQIEELKQEKNELSRADRVMKIAKEAGLVVNDNNLRKVTK